MCGFCDESTVKAERNLKNIRKYNKNNLTSDSVGSLDMYFKVKKIWQTLHPVERPMLIFENDTKIMKIERSIKII